MIALIIQIAILGLIYWAVGLIPLEDPFPKVIRVIFIVILVVMLLNFLGVDTGLHV